MNILMDTFVEAHYLTAESEIENIRNGPSVILMLRACPRRGDHIILSDGDEDDLKRQLRHRLEEMTEAGKEYNPYDDPYGSYYISREEGFRGPGEVVNKVVFIKVGGCYEIHIFLGKLLFDNEDGTQMDFCRLRFRVHVGGMWQHARPFGPGGLRP